MTTADVLRTSQATAPGKVILLGEHAVVYGRTALAGAIDRRIRVRLTPTVDATCPTSNVQIEGTPRAKPPFAAALSPQGERAPSYPPATQQALVRAAALLGLKASGFSLTVDGDLPMAVGLGSSAAMSVAMFRALARYCGRPLDGDTLCAHAYEIEKLFHGHPSGIDNTVAVHGGLVAFRRGEIPRLLSGIESIALVVALGRAPRSTRTAVEALRLRYESDPGSCEPLFDEIEDLVRLAEPGLESADLQSLGDLMNANHALLRQLGVSTDELDAIVRLARAEGAFGAKLTGGGGGGAVICVGDKERLLAAFRHAGFASFTTNIASTRRGENAAHDAEQVDERGAALA